MRPWGCESGDAALTEQVALSTVTGATLEKVESWIHSELGAGWAGAWNGKEARVSRVLVRWRTSVSGLNAEVVRMAGQWTEASRG